MAFTLNKSLSLFFALFLVFSFSQITFAVDDWKPVTAEELNLESSKVEPNADAEAIFWEIKVVDDYNPRIGFQSFLEHYIRIKVFTDRGRENHSKVQIPFGKHSDGERIIVTDISARTTKPDGKEVLLDEKDIFEQEIVKADGVKLKGKSFVVPGIEIGSIIEYRWKEIRRDNFSFYVRLQIAREIPVQFVKYYLKPFADVRFELGMRLQTFNTDAKLAKEPEGFYSMTAKNVPSYKEESYMPPEYSVKPWLLVYYAFEYKDTGVSQEKYWKNVGKRTYDSHNFIYKGSKDIKQKAFEIIGDETNSLEKVRRIFSFCRNNIKNLYDDASGLKSEDYEKIKRNKSEKDTLKRGQGTRHDIDMLFASMVNAVGLDVRVASFSPRTNPPLNKHVLNDYLLKTETIAVNIDDNWQFFSPSLQHLPFNMLRWDMQGQEVLISDNDQAIWEKIPYAEAERSKRNRFINLTLDEDGLLEGDVRIEYSGHFAQTGKENIDEESDQEREKAVIEMAKNLISDTTEISDVEIENLKDTEKPLVFKFKIKIANYVDRTGKRIFIKPNIFANNAKARFSTSERQNDIFFRFPWTETDVVTIKIPDGYSLETADPLKTIEDTSKLGLHQAEITFEQETKTIKYKRNFSFGKKGELYFVSKSYDSIKTLFDHYENADKYAVTLVLN